ncbi:MAG: hypothetical protein JWO67_4587 [Streptosporangiaceae bacterium]|nr:hypothetical protein [Streptosporangiaceae bacterium]
MALEGVDFSFDRMSAATAAQNGLSFVGRYLSTTGAKKNLTASEKDEFLTNGLDLVVVFEEGAGQALKGKAQGAADAQVADDQLNNLGLRGSPVHFAVDVDVTPGQLSQVQAYFDGVASIIPVERIGIYGGIRVVSFALDNDLATYGWQTVSWSQGQVEPRAHLLQYQINTVLADVHVDRNRTVSSDFDFGQVHPVPPPEVTGVSPTGGDPAGGTTVVITGSGFLDATDVGFGVTDAADMSIDSDTQITAVSPPGAGTVDILVTTLGGSSQITPADQFSYGTAFPVP